MNPFFATLIGRIRRETADLEQVVRRTEQIWSQASRTPDDYYVDAAALNLHAFYAGVEHLMELVADGIDRSKPSSANWHQELLRQMASELPGIRPALLREETRNQLDSYRGFWHVVRNVYTFHLDPEQIALLIRRLRPTMIAVSADLTRFIAFLEETGNPDP